jgi:pilus assembly protein CpaC
MTTPRTKRLACASAFALAGLASQGLGVARAQPPARHAQPPTPTVTNTTKESAPAKEGLEELHLALGESKTIPANGVRNYSEGTPGVVEVKLTPDGSSFILHTRKTGSTTLLLLYGDGSQTSYSINVWAKSPQTVERDAAQLTEGMPNVRRKRVGGRVVLDGTVANDAELKRIQQIAALYPGQLDNLVTLAQAAPQAEAGPEEERYLIRIDFYFIQYDKRSGYQIGLGFPDSVGQNARASVTFDFLAGATRSATASLQDQPLPRLDMASRHGWAKVLKQATVVTNNGIEASFQNGGEQLYTVTQGLATGIQRVAFGADVTVMPRFRADKGALEVKVQADVSELSTAGNGTPLPSRITSRLATNVTLKLGQALVLSGIRSKYQSHDVSGLPLLSSIPVLGVLFGSHQNRMTETEGAIFVVPSVVTPAAKASAELVDAALAAFEEYSGEIEDVNLYPKPPNAVLRSAPRGK